MNSRAEKFKRCAHQAGQTLNCRPGALIRRFGLGDFLENALSEEDDIRTTAIKAIRFFCDEYAPKTDKFRFAVLSVGIFLNTELTPARREMPIQAMVDLVNLLGTNPTDELLAAWINSHFG